MSVLQLVLSGHSGASGDLKNWLKITKMQFYKSQIQFFITRILPYPKASATLAVSIHDVLATDSDTLPLF